MAGNIAKCQFYGFLSVFVAIDTVFFLNNLMMVIMYAISGYISTLRNNVRSRAWGAAIGCSYRVERCCIVKVVSEPLQSLLLPFAIFSSCSYMSRSGFICSKCCHVIYFIIFHSKYNVRLINLFSSVSSESEFCLNASVLVL